MTLKCHVYAKTQTCPFIGFDDEMLGGFLLCLWKSCSDGPIWACAAVPEDPSRGSSWSQGGTAPTMQQTKAEPLIHCSHELT